MSLTPLIPIQYLEYQVINFCNFTCDYCDHYSNYKHKGIASLDQLEVWLSDWSKKVQPSIFKLLGGEPTIHPKLPLFIPLVRKYFKYTQIHIVSNSSFLHKHPNLPIAMTNDGNCRLCISLHHNSKDYQLKIKPNVDLANKWRSQYNILVSFLRSYEHWTVKYKGFGSSMEPFSDNNIKASFDICRARECFQLVNGNIYKCAPIAYLNMQNNLHKLSDSWTQYLNYVPISVQDDYDKMLIFFNTRAEPICGMCPSRRVFSVVNDPTIKS